MNRRYPPVLLAVLLATQMILVFTAQIQTASAAPNFTPYVEVYDKDGNVRNEFLIGEKAGIRANLLLLYEIKVIDPDGNVAYHDWQLFGEFDSGLLDCITTKTGSWEVEVNSLLFHCWHVRGEFNVVPFGAFGALGMLAMCFSALGMKSLRTKRKTQKP